MDRSSPAARSICEGERLACAFILRPKAKLREKLKMLTKRSDGWGYEKRKEKLAYAIRGGG